MYNRHTYWMLCSLFNSVAFNSPKRRILDELKQHEPVKRYISDIQGTYSTDSLEMFRNIRKRGTKLSIQDDWHRTLRPSSPPYQLRALERHLCRVQLCIHHSHPAFLRTALPSITLPFTELSRERNVLLCYHSTRDTRAEHAVHKVVECRRREMNRRGFGHCDRELDPFDSATLAAAQCDTHLGNDYLVVVQCALHERTEAIIVFESLEWGEFSDPTRRVSASSLDPTDGTNLSKASRYMS